MNTTNTSTLILTIAVIALPGCARVGPAPTNQAQGTTTVGISANQMLHSVPPHTPSENAASARPDGSVTVTAPQNVAMQNLPPLQSVDFVNGQVGYVGGTGAILRTTDGGRTWFQVFSGPEVVTHIDAYDAQHVWATTAHHGLLVSDDGQDWRTIDAPGTLQGIDVTGPGLGYVIAGGNLLHSSDDGVHFTAKSLSTAVDSASFVNDQIGYTVSGNVVLKTINGGQSWDKMYTAPVTTSGDGQWHSRIRATAQGVWLMLYGAEQAMSQMSYVVFHSTDGGHTWSAVMDESYLSSAYPSVRPSLTNSEWQMLQPGPFTTVGDTPYFVGWNPTQGDHLVLTTYTNSRWHIVPAGQLDSVDIPDFFSSPLDVAFTEERSGWIVGSKNSRGKILSSHDGGLSWQTVR